MIIRESAKKLKQLARSFKVVAVTGARQTGKTTLVKTLFPNKPYVSLENPDMRQYAETDPKGFLSSFPKGAIFDEAQRVPDLFSYIQEIVDNSTKKGIFILTGSNNFLLNQAISQSLAGRVGYLYLPTFSVTELNSASKLPKGDNELIIKGTYPPVYSQKINPYDWSVNYIKTYIERDLRQLKNINDLTIFERFLAVLAGRCGQELNMNSIATDVGVDMKTIRVWIGLLEASFIIYLLKPHYKNFNKTIVKRPKLYFQDTGVACALLRISKVEHLTNHPLKGALFENMVVMELAKKRMNAGLPINLYYWRDKTGHEIDIIVEEHNKLIPVEIKSAQTFHGDLAKNLTFWQSLSETRESVLLYGGKVKQKRTKGLSIIPWREYI